MFPDRRFMRFVVQGLGDTANRWKIRKNARTIDIGIEDISVRAWPEFEKAR
jgi:hypothetical protein